MPKFGILSYNIYWFCCVSRHLSGAKWQDFFKRWAKRAIRNHLAANAQRKLHFQIVEAGPSNTTEPGYFLSNQQWQFDNVTSVQHSVGWGFMTGPYNFIILRPDHRSKPSCHAEPKPKSVRAAAWRAGMWSPGGSGYQQLIMPAKQIRSEKT